MSSLVVESRRGGARESVHQVSVAVVDTRGRRFAWSGDPGFDTFLRSAAKPFQAIPLVADGGAAHFAISDAEIALACASHNAEPEQVAIVRGLLDRIGCRPDDLVCGSHRSLALELGVVAPDKPYPADLVSRSPIASNCSGKHTAMMAAALASGWPVAGYERADHPVQRRCLEEVARWTGVPAERIGQGVDGCGVVSFRLPLEGLALAFARFGTSHEPAAARVRQAMMRYPHLIAGTNRLCTELMQQYPGQVLAKVGADGVYGVTLPPRGLGIGMKVEDGHSRATMVALIAVLDRLGFEPLPSTVLPRFARFPIINTRQAEVGELVAAGALTFE